ncbi:hypothetical protein GALMADRAFT_231235 [Galerina marginata CBS 339.88]|uniref:Uncharacterized protein n=1 Tax=Galerina marginata (strain CBS 339.88) TaxID=685588 RepID=A0A067SF02_GALM3|nr:hypothetical protein GALMADRAFT_231235 [Galerina marginata CBS 339.88]
MDPHAIDYVLEGAARALVAESISSKVRRNPKRYAVYFPTKAIVDARTSEIDAYSAWEFSAPLPPHTRSSSYASCESSGSTPAQEIAIRYRAAQSFESETRSSSPSLYSEPDSWDEASLDALFVAHDRNLKAVYRESRNEALKSTFQEAVNVVKTSGVSSNDKVVCLRPGCRDVLPNATALMYHLHIHDIHDRSIVCGRCKELFEDQRAIDSHNCEKPPRLSRPFLGAFQRIISRLSFNF